MLLIGDHADENWEGSCVDFLRDIEIFEVPIPVLNDRTLR